MTSRSAMSRRPAMSPPYKSPGVAPGLCKSVSGAIGPKPRRRVFARVHPVLRPHKATQSCYGCCAIATVARLVETVQGSREKLCEGGRMDFAYDAKTEELRERLTAFMES